MEDPFDTTSLLEQEKQKVIKAIKNGNVVIDQEAAESLKSMKLHDPDFSIIGTELECWGKTDRNQGGFEIRWRTVSAGFGSITFHIDSDGDLYCDTEGMSREFAKDVLSHLLDRAVIDTEV